MEYKEYMDTLGEQIQNARARRMVLGEIQGHIEEQCRAYEAQGMDPQKAMAESIRQMGDPAQTGAELDRIHRPRTPWGLIGLALGLTAVGIIIQCLIFYGIADSPSWTNVWLHHGRNTVVYNLVGLAVMLGIMHLDYSFVGRHPAGQEQISAAHGADAGAKRMIALKSVGSAGEWRFLLRDFFAAGEK